MKNRDVDVQQQAAWESIEGLLAEARQTVGSGRQRYSECHW